MAALSMAVSALLVLAALSRGTVIDVPADYPTIQAAINAAVDGDTILVAPGTYVENINFIGKNIVVTSSGGSTVTTIDGNHAGSVVTFTNGETEAAILSCLTIMNGLSGEGGGVFIDGSSPTVTQCTIMNNTATNSLQCGGGISVTNSHAMISLNLITQNVSNDWGGGILCDAPGTPTITQNIISNNMTFQAGGIFCADNSAPIISNNLVIDNVAGQSCGGIWCHWNSRAVVSGNIILRNSCADSGGGMVTYTSNSVIVNNVIALNSSGAKGGGVFVSNYSLNLTNNTIYGNTNSGPGGGISSVAGAVPVLTNCILWGNSPDEVQGPVTATYCDIQGGYSGTGNIDADPLFVDPSNDFHLLAGSPCRDVGWNMAPDIPATDFEGDPRIVGIVDMGADETAAPIVSGVSPWRSRYDIGVAATVTGGGFLLDPSPVVGFGGAPATNVVVIDDSTITCTVTTTTQPGPVDVTVTNSIGSGTLTDGFTYTPAIQITGNPVPDGTITVTYLNDPGDDIFAIYGLPPIQSIQTPPYDGTLCIVPLYKLFVILGWPFDTLSQTLVIPDDPNLSGVQVLIQGLIGPKIGGYPQDAAWTNCGVLAIQ